MSIGTINYGWLKVKKKVLKIVARNKKVVGVRRSDTASRALSHSRNYNHDLNSSDDCQLHR